MKIHLIVFILLFANTAHAASIDGYPHKPIRMAIPMEPGGPVDITARLVAKRLTEKLGQPVLVENRAGAGGSLAPTYVARSAPDGSVILFMSKSSLLSKLLLATNSTYDMLGELAPITQTDSQETILVANAKVPAQSLKELIDLARSTPGKLSYASNGVGSGNHLNIELFKSGAKIDIVHVPYKGQSPAMTDLLSGRIDVTSLGMALATQSIKTGQIKALAITGSKRNKLLPDLPTFAEQGIPGLENGSWKGFLAPKGTSDVVIQKLYSEIVQVMNSSDASKLLEGGEEVVGSSPEAFRQFLIKEQELWRKVIKDIGLNNS